MIVRATEICFSSFKCKIIYCFFENKYSILVGLFRIIRTSGHWLQKYRTSSNCFQDVNERTYWFSIHHHFKRQGSRFLFNVISSVCFFKTLKIIKYPKNIRKKGNATNLEFDFVFSHLIHCRSYCSINFRNEVNLEEK